MTIYDKIRGPKEKIPEAIEKNEAWLEKIDLGEIKKYELEINERDEDIVIDAQNGVDKMVKTWGGDPKQIPRDRIFILEDGGVRKASNNRFELAFSSFETLKMVIEHLNSDIGLACNLAHEFFHLKSYKEGKLLPRDEKGIDGYRSGLNIYLHGVNLFDDLEEAIVSKAEIIFFEKYVLTNPLYKSDLEKLGLLKYWLRKVGEKLTPNSVNIELEIKRIFEIRWSEESIGYLESDKTEEEKISYLKGYLRALGRDSIRVFTRDHERMKLDTLIKEIIQKSNGIYTDADEVFEIFARANFSGNLKPLVKLIEETLGHGSFKRVGIYFS